MHEQVVALLEKQVPACQPLLVKRQVGDPVVFVNPDSIYRVCQALFHDPDLDFHVLQVITGCDYLNTPKKENLAAQKARIEVSYLLTSLRKNHDLILKVQLPRENPTLDSVCDIWASAHFQERECFDMLGVNFKNNPDLRRILCPDDWEGHPLRRDYQVQKAWHGMEVEPKSKMNFPEREFEQRQK